MMSLFVRLAFRNLLRHTRRTLITLISVACGCAVLLWLQAVLFGRNQNMIDVITSTYTGYVQIYNNDYLKSKLTSKYMPEKTFDTEVKPLLQNAIFTPRLHLPTLLSSGEETVPLNLVGIDPVTESQITKIKNNVVEGQFLSDQQTCEKKEIFIGRELAKNLNVGVGEKVVALTQALDGTLGNDLYRVSGLFDSKSPDFDKNFVFIHYRCAQALGQVPGFHEVVLKPDVIEDMDKMQAGLKDQLQGKYQVTTWREALPEVERIITFNDALLKMITFILFTVITMGVINTLMMSLFERTKEFGVLLSLGMSPMQLRLLVILESFFLAVIGITLGTVLGLIVVGYEQRTGFDMSPFFGGKAIGSDNYAFDLIIKPIFKAGPYFKVVLTELIFLTVAGLFPAYKISQLKPIEALRS